MQTNEILQVIVPIVVALLVFLGIDVSAEQITAIMSAAIAAVITIIAIWERNKKVTTSIALDNQVKNTNTARAQAQALIQPELAKPDVIAALPARAWKMSQETIEFLCSGNFRPYCPGIKAQIAAAEADHKVHYFVDTGLSGIQYEIEYGLLKQQIGNTT